MQESENPAITSHLSAASCLVISDVIVVRRDVIVRWRHQTRSSK